MIYTKEHQKALKVRLLAEAISTLELTASDTCAALSDELRDMFPGKYAYVRDVIGDGESGDVIYCCDGETWRAPYEIGMVNGKRTCTIDDDQAINVVPRTVYDEEADEGDHYAGMSDTDAAEAKRMPPWMRRMVLTERFVSKAERDAMDPSDFAGKGQSYPIKKPGDINAAVRSIGRAGDSNKSPSALKASIIRIAKKKGWAKYLPKAWQGDGGSTTTESAGTGSVDELVLVESAATLETIVIREAKADYEIKLIAPGKGSTAFYTPEVLKRDGPKVFTEGTKVYLNHQTIAEEAARPEGKVEDMAGVLSTNAYYADAHVKGPGLYSRMKVFADHGQMVEEKAQHVGMSIRANGKAVLEAGRVVHKEGVPLLAALTSRKSVDIVTEAGAGGLILSESATGAQETDMDEAAVKKLIESAVTQAVTAAIAGVQAPVKTLEQRALRGDATVEANRVLSGLNLKETSKQFVIENVLRGEIPVKDGAFDAPKFTELVTAEAKRVAAVFAAETGSGHVFGLGPSTTAGEPSKKELKEAKREKKALKEARKGNALAWQEFGLSESAAKIAAEGRVQ